MWPISFPIVALYCQILSLKNYTFHSKNTLVDESDVQALVKRFKKNCLNLGTAFVQTITGLPANLLSGNQSRLSATVIPNVYSPLVSTCAWEFLNWKNDGLILTATAIGSCRANRPYVFMLLFKIELAKAETRPFRFLSRSQSFFVSWTRGFIVTSRPTALTGTPASNTIFAASGSE